jgi:ribosomal protein S4
VAAGFYAARGSLDETRHPPHVPRRLLRGPVQRLQVRGLKPSATTNTAITSNIRGKNPKFSWLDWNEKEMKGIFIAYPERESVPENIKEQLIVELYSK